MELLLTIAITGILASLSVSLFKEYKERIYDLEAKMFLTDMEKAVVDVLVNGFDRSNLALTSQLDGYNWATFKPPFNKCLTDYFHNVPNPFLKTMPDLCGAKYQDLEFQLTIGYYATFGNLGLTYPKRNYGAYNLQCNHRKSNKRFIIQFNDINGRRDLQWFQLGGNGTRFAW